MSGLETAIRSALERSDRTKADVRARIYQSARQALESGLRKQSVNDPETVAEQRHRLEATIHAIEQEERERLKEQANVDPPVKPAPVLGAKNAQTRPASRPDIPMDVQPEIPAVERRSNGREDGRVDSDDDDGALSFGVDRDHGAKVDPGMSLDRVTVARDDRPESPLSVHDDENDGFAAVAAATDARPTPKADKKQTKRAIKASEKRAAKPRRRRGFLAQLFVFVVVMTSVAIAAWWVYSTGILLNSSERQSGFQPPPPTASADDFAGSSQEPKTIDPQRGFSSAWIEVFKPSEVQKITARANATVDVQGASDGQAMHIVSRSADPDGAAVVQISPDVLREMAGKTSTIALTVQSSGEKPIQFSVSCGFDRLGGCSRHRFTANPERADLLFRVTLPNSAVPSAPGQLLINADMSGQGEGINLYSIRVLPGQ